MSESGGINGSSSLAIVEKKPQRTGGCVGIFFQLLEWNKRFAKKRLFSKKLLPPAGAKQAAKKFGGDEKQPKLLLIADENCGGFPNAKKNGAHNVNSEPIHGVKAPSLVARLMGLEPMPMVQQEDTIKKHSSTEKNDKIEKISGLQLEFGRVSQESEKGGTKHEVRPPKLQKTGVLERGPVTKLGTEALHFKNVLSRSRKYHHHHHNHPKLLSPVKSPRNLSGKNSSRLIGAATKILEPGLQARSRAKSAITYTHNGRRGPTNQLVFESMKHISPESSNYYMNESKSMKAQSSCKNCGNLLDVVHCRPYIDDHFAPPAPFSSFDQENDRVFRKRQEHSAASLARAVDNIRNHVDFSSDRMMMMLPQDRGQRHLTSQHSRPQTSPASIGYNKQKFQRQNEVRPNNQQKKTKDFVALNRNLNGQTRSKLSAKVDDCKFDNGKKFGSKREDFTSGRKRRPMNVNTLDESSHNAFDKTIVNDGSGGNKNDTIAFKFNSPMKHKSEVTSKGASKDQKMFPLTGDSLGALLDQKLKELTSQGEDERDSSHGIQPKRTSAMILQELIFALTAEKRPPQKEMDYEPNAKPVSKYRGQSLNSKKDLRFQGKSKIAGASFGYECDDDHHRSPGCVLEASFSNDSSLDDTYGRMFHEHISSYVGPHQMNVDSDNFYHWTSSRKERSSRELVIDLLNYICEVLYNIDLTEARLKGNKLNHAKEVIFNAELVLGHTSLTSSHEIETFSVSNFLLDELETLASVLWTNFSNFLGFEDTKEGNQLSGFIFDCMVEHLDSNYGKYSKSRIGAWKSLPFFMNSEKMIHEVVEEVRGWMSLAGLSPDELIEREMSYGLGKWTDFEIQAFETGVDIEWMILHSLVDEVVGDLYECDMGF